MSVGLSISPKKAKRLSGSGCRWDGEGVSRGMGVLDGVVIIEGEGAVFWG